MTWADCTRAAEAAPIDERRCDMRCPKDRILDAQAAHGWTDDTLIGILLDAIEQLDPAGIDTVLLHVQYVVDSDEAHD